MCSGLPSTSLAAIANANEAAIEGPPPWVTIISIALATSSTSRHS